MKGLLVLVAALVVTAAELENINNKVPFNVGDGPVYKEVARQRRAFNLWPFSRDVNEYSCQITPFVSFYPGDNSEPMPAYLCTNGHLEVLIATRSFYLGYNRFEYATYAKLTIDPTLLHIEYPGYFTQTPKSLTYRHSSGAPPSQTVAITGLLFLSENGVQRANRLFQFLNPTLYKCEFVPTAIFNSADIASAPVYRCIRGVTEILVATDSFIDNANPTTVSSKEELNIGNDILQYSYPGSFHQTNLPTYRGNPALTHKGGEFSVRGLLILAD